MSHAVICDGCGQIMGEPVSANTDRMRRAPVRVVDPRTWVIYMPNANGEEQDVNEVHLHNAKCLERWVKAQMLTEPVS